MTFIDFLKLFLAVVIPVLVIIAGYVAGAVFAIVKTSSKSRKIVISLVAIGIIPLMWGIVSYALFAKEILPI